MSKNAFMFCLYIQSFGGNIKTFGKNLIFLSRDVIIKVL